MAIGEDVVGEEIVAKITVDDKELQDLPGRMTKVTAAMRAELALTGGVAEKTGDQWTKVAADMLRSTMSVGNATSLLATQLKKELPAGAKAVEIAIKIMDKALTQTMVHMMKDNVPMEEMTQQFNRLGVSGEDFTRILGVAQTQLVEMPKAIAPAIAGMAEFGEEAKFSGEMLFTATGKGLISIISQMREGGMSAKEAATAFNEVGRSGKGLEVAFVKGGYALDATKQAFEELAPAAKKTDYSIRNIAASLEWAAYRFMFTLAVYMGFRKVIRMVNEAIAEANKLFKEFREGAGQFANAVQLASRMIPGFTAKMEDWIPILEGFAAKYGVMITELEKGGGALVRQMALMGRSKKETEDFLDMVVNLYRQVDEEGRTTFTQFAEAVTSAMKGSYEALQSYGIPITEELIVAWYNTGHAGEEAIEKLSDLSEANKALLTYLYIIQETGKIQVDTTQDQIDSVHELTTELDTLASNTGRVVGYFTSQWKAGTSAVKVMLNGLILAFYLFTDAQTRAFAGAAAWGAIVAFVDALQKGKGVTQAWADAQLVATLVMEEWGKTVMENVYGVEKENTAVKELSPSLKNATAEMKKLSKETEDATEAFEDLGDAVTDAMREFEESRTQAGIDYWKDYNDTLEDQKKDELKLEKRYADKADDFRKRAADKIADLRKRAAEEEENDRADLLLRLHQMEEDYQLSMKQLYEQTALDIEEAARSRDWRAIRTIQRRYALEKKQRKEDYQLQRHQTIESWEARHKENQKNFDEEIKEIQDSLAEELAELEAERAEELQEIRDNWDERRQELKDQYAEELADLKTALERRLTDAITEWANQNNIPRDAVIAAVAEMARQYDLDATNLADMVTTELKMLETLRLAWEEVAKAAAGMPTESVLKRFGPGWGKIPKLEGVEGFAEGGMAIATAPTLVRVGEAGPELFTAIPLARGGSVLGGARGYAGGDFHLSIDGNQTGLWSSDFERGVEHTVAKIFKEAFQE